ncbi:putative transposase [Gluconacetobacter diazotrophicus PA1 5]|uniref:Putative transposase n=1 Tax=Gluconacetobacter diazotrophicus (strain ATCC 49037 / DSM 5601 / CCUG 37298 / CIP 103539 / LMG 7603 / PAl5) TaxID=272568 RepID=A9HC94_GLUDA|nr:putative transposase [Gluconacetobacter diazotrophicus PA1 5]
MACPYSMDLRERVVRAVETDGLSCHEAAKRYGVAPITAIRWMQNFRRTGSVSSGQMGGHKPKRLKGCASRVADRALQCGGFYVAGLGRRTCRARP